LIFIGLGNPGTKYEQTRHNVGFLAVEKAAEKAGIALKKGFSKKYRAAEGRYRDHKTVFIEPLTFMNNSGQIIHTLRRKYQLAPDNMVLVCDNLDLPPGTCRIKRGGGSAGHNGIASVIQFLGSNDFLRVYIGIGRPPYSGDVIGHVLGVPPSMEKPYIKEGIEKAAEAILQLIDHAPEKVMNEFNRRVNSQ
jgi:PTH1 family peptidyl-tRNA hydrolase